MERNPLSEQYQVTKTPFISLEASLSAPPRRWPVEECQHLYLDVRSQTSASWIFLYRFRSKNKQEIALGSAVGKGGVKVTLSDAKRKATAFNGMLARDEDPKQGRVRTAKTFEDLLKEEIEIRERGTAWGEGKAWTSWAKNYFPRLLPMRPQHVTRQHVLDALAEGWVEARPTALRALYVLDVVMNRAKLTGLYPNNLPNPADTSDITQLLGNGGKKQAKPQASLHHSKAPAWMVKVLSPLRGATWQTMGNRRKALLVAATVPHRSNEINVMKRADVDLETGVWNTPAEDNKKGRAQVNVLPWQVIEVLKSIPEVEGNPYFFTGSEKGGRPSATDPIAAGGMWEVLRKEMKVPAVEANIHGFRSTIVTWAGETQGVEREQLKDMLSHKSAHTKGKDGEVIDLYYRPAFIEKRGKILQAWADYLFPASFAKNNVTQLRAA